MIVIGLTGGIGSGKTTVSQILSNMGAVVLDADKIGHELYSPHTETWHLVVGAFGEDILQPSGEIDRRKLGKVVFSDPRALARLNRIMHPRMYDIVKEKIEDEGRKGTKVMVVEAAILLEAHWTPLVDQVWVVQAPEDVVIQRLRDKNGFSEEQARNRIRSQLSPQERAKQADVIINNDGDLSAVRSNVEALWEKHIKVKGLV
ncbi:MAG: dephospho-CoA kinase [Dehalococcoidia bacterium]